MGQRSLYAAFEPLTMPEVLDEAGKARTAADLATATQRKAKGEADAAKERADTAVEREAQILRAVGSLKPLWRLLDGEVTTDPPEGWAPSQQDFTAASPPREPIDVASVDKPKKGRTREVVVREGMRLGDGVRTELAPREPSGGATA